MSLFAGVYSLEPSGRLNRPLLDTIVAELSRSGDRVDVYEDDRFFLVKLDLGAFGEPAFLRGDSVAAATGELYLRPQSGRANSRAEDLGEVADHMRRGEVHFLRECQGSFSLCYYDTLRHNLMVAADRIGVRAVYYGATAQFLAFSSNLRVLEALDALPKSMDLRGVTELSVFGFPLGRRTPYAQINALRGGEALHCQDGRVDIIPYFKLADLQPTSLTRDEMLAAAHDVFLAALECRSSRDSTATSFLSGGLDSRVVVAGLSELGKDVYTLTYEVPGRMDAAIAKRFASEIGTCHTTDRVDASTPQRALQAKALGRVSYRPDQRPKLPNLIFSGDGGSVGVGFIYMAADLVELLRTGSQEEVLAHLRAFGRLPKRVFRSDFFGRISQIVAEGIREELGRIQTGDPVRDYHIFLMDNDQRRHLHHLYEDLDRDRIEFLLPFFDGRFVELIGSAPADWFLLHRFYNDWLGTFPEATRTVPWQSYPGHVPCPVPLGDVGAYHTQWKGPRAEKFARSAPLYNRCLQSFLSGRLPSRVFRRARIAVALILHGLRFRDCGHIWTVCDPFQTYYALCQGRIADGREVRDSDGQICLTQESSLLG